MQQNNDQKYTATTKDFIREKRWKVFNWPSQSPDLNPIEHSFDLLKRRLKGPPPPPPSLVMSMLHRLEAGIASKGYATKY